MWNRVYIIYPEISMTVIVEEPPAAPPPVVSEGLTLRLAVAVLLTAAYIWYVSADVEAGESKKFIGKVMLTPA